LVSILGEYPVHKIIKYKYENHGSDLIQMVIKYTFFNSRKTFYNIYDNPSDHIIKDFFVLVFNYRRGLIFNRLCCTYCSIYVIVRTLYLNTLYNL